MALPLEVFEHIMCFCDGPTLVEIGRASPTLESLMKKPGTKLNKNWAKICDTDIPIIELKEVLREQAPYYWSEPEKVNWAIIYATWDKRRRLKEVSEVRMTSFTTDGIINVVKVSGAWTLVGTSEPGRLIAVNLQGKQHVLFRGCGILDIQLRATKCQRPRILPGLVHCEAILYLDSAQDFILSLVTGKVIKKLNREFGLFQIRWFENYTVTIKFEKGTVVSVTNETTKKTISWRPEYPCLYLPQLQFDHPDKFLIIEAWKDKFWIASESGWLVEVDYNLKVLSNQQCLLQRLGKEDYHRWHSQIYRTQDNTFSLVTEINSPAFVRVRETAYPQNFSAFLFYCGVLYLGCDEGSFLIHSYRTSDNNIKGFYDFLPLNPFEFASYITDICPIELPGETSLLVSTKHNIYIVYLSEK